MVLGTAPIEGRLSGVVDIPNACSTVYLPTAIFDIDLRPGHGKVPKVSGGMAVPKSLWKDHKGWAPHPWKK
jgi:formamidase